MGFMDKYTHSRHVLNYKKTQEKCYPAGGVGCFKNNIKRNTYRFNPMPIASVATRILQGSFGSLNFLAWDNFVPVEQRSKTVHQGYSCLGISFGSYQNNLGRLL